MLKPKQIKCIDMLILAEKTQAEIAKEIKVSEQTICNWKKDEEFIAEYNNRIKSCISSLAPKALKTMKTLLSSDTDKVRFSAAKDLLDRSGFKPTENVKVDGKLEQETSKLDSLIEQMMGE